MIRTIVCTAVGMSCGFIAGVVVGELLEPGAIRHESIFIVAGFVAAAGGISGFLFGGLTALLARREAKLNQHLPSPEADYREPTRPN